MFHSHGTTLTVPKFRGPAVQVRCEQDENIERTLVNEASGPIFQPIEKSSGARRVNEPQQQ